ncbi:signal peptidase I [Vagococcus penaei]|uniref:Signal peptidase I n=1 Tax=Vagococcus penaei TaxID=633807 RepID=A0A1Q2D5R3_9ENTE|nr:signal peptidase I [Vagococcus penaei]AQP53651.1 signal peptidase I [Vagococcus penaei]RST98087.1 signal peptidase I [Vagococcus penaei]
MITFCLLTLLFFVIVVRVSDQKTYFGYQLKLVLSDSMGAAIPKNSLIAIKVADKNPLQVGDIVSVQVNDEFVTHRIAMIEDSLGTKTLITKGDQNSQVDSRKTEADTIVGKVKFVIPYIGILWVLLAKPAILILIIMVILIMIVIKKYGHHLLGTYIYKKRRTRQ